MEFAYHEAKRMIANMNQSVAARPMDDPERVLVELAEKVAFTEFGGRAQDEVFEDIVCEAYAQIPKILNSYDPDKGTSLTSWGWRLMKNACLNLVRKEDRRTNVEQNMDHWQEPTEVGEDNENNPSSINWQRDTGWFNERTGAGQRAMEWHVDYELVQKLLEPREQVILQMLLEGETQTYIGNALGISQSRVNRLITGIRDKVALEVS